jgi:hypothetical protein
MDDQLRRVFFKYTKIVISKIQNRIKKDTNILKLLRNDIYELNKIVNGLHQLDVFGDLVEKIYNTFCSDLRD